jgi:N-formylglutamate deformylase
MTVLATVVNVPGLADLAGSRKRAPGAIASIAAGSASGFNVSMDLPLPTDRAACLDSVSAGAGAPAFTLAQPADQTVPLVFASAHSGRNYHAAFVSSVRLDPVALRRSEDSFVDELFSAAPAHGAPLLAATFPRAFCDANREAWELDPAMFDEKLPDWVNTTSARVGAGLGTIARVVASGETIYRRKLRFAEAEQRVRTCWQPFHEGLEGLIARTRLRFGGCVLIDCHSMPAAVSPGRGGADMVLGDAHGTTCAPRTIRLVEQVLEGLGYRVRRNDPYAGGFITRHYGRPREGVEAVQIEISRSLYMDETRIEKSPGFGRVQHDMGTLIAALAAASHAGAAA